MPRGVCTLTVLNEKDSYIGEQCTAYHLTALLFWLHSGWYEKIHENELLNGHHIYMQEFPSVHQKTRSTWCRLS